MSQRWLSNSYVVGDQPGGHGVLIDAGGPPEPILASIQANDLIITHVLLTHHHGDHVVHTEAYREHFDCPVLGHAAEREHCNQIQDLLDDGQEITSGGLTIRALHTPGHTQGMLAFVVNDEIVFTGDTLFRDSVGGTVAPGHGTYAQLKHSILQVLLQLPGSMRVLPGHTDETTIEREREHNPFIRIWRGLEPEGNTPVTALGRPATLVLRALDYDGGTKCWVRFGEEDAIVPGSRVSGD